MVYSKFCGNTCQNKDWDKGMKSNRYRSWAVVIILLCCILAVVFFPMASDNMTLYKAIVFTSIAIVLLLLFFLVKVNILESDEHRHIID